MIYLIHKGAAGNEIHGLGGLAVGHRLRGFLHFHILFIYKSTQIMHDLKRKSAFALRAVAGFLNPAHHQVFRGLEPAIGALEDSFAHFGVNFTAADDDAANLN